MRRVKQELKPILLTLAILSIALASSPASAITLYWMGGANAWNTTSSRWSPTVDGTTYQTWTLSGELNDAVFGRTAGVVTISTSTTPVVGNITFTTTGYSIGAATAASTNALALGADSIITAGDGIPATFTTEIKGSYGLTKAGDGTVIFKTSGNSYTGATIVSGGMLKIEHNTSLGTTDAGTTVNDGATLEVSKGLTVTGETLTLNGSGYNNSGALLFTGTTYAAQWAGDIVLGSNATIASTNASSKTLTIGVAGATTITGSGNTLTVAGSGPIQIDSSIQTGAGSVVKDSSASLILMGASTYSGDTVLNSGNTYIGVETVTSGGALVSSGIGTGTLKLNGGSLAPTSSMTTDLTLYNEVEFNADTTLRCFGTAAMEFAGDVTLTGNRTAIIGSKVVISGAIGDGGNGYELGKTGAAELVLSGLNSYTGDTTVNDGILTLADGGSMLFDIQNAGECTQLLGTGTLNLDGMFVFNLAGVTDAAGDWMVVDVDNLTATYGSTFSVKDFTESSDVWTYVDGAKTWTFTESTGILSVSAVPEPGTMAMFVMGLIGLLAYAWRKRK